MTERKERPPSQVWFEKVLRSAATHSTKSVAAVIYLHAYGMKIESFPSYPTISEELGGMGKSTISKAIRQLESMGALSVTKQKTKAGVRNHYTLNKNFQSVPYGQLGSPEIATPSVPCGQLGVVETGLEEAREATWEATREATREEAIQDFAIAQSCEFQDEEFQGSSSLASSNPLISWFQSLRV